MLQTWSKSSFRQRNLLLKTLVKYIVANQDTICRCAAAARESADPDWSHASQSLTDSRAAAAPEA